MAGLATDSGAPGGFWEQREARVECEERVAWGGRVPGQRQPCGWGCRPTGGLGAEWGLLPASGSTGPAHRPPAHCQVFTLPKVSAKTKFKLTAHEGCRVRKVALATFASVACEDYAETCLACLTNLGDVHVFSVPGLRPQVHYSCIRKEDISGIASCVFTRHGQGEGKASWRGQPERAREGFPGRARDRPAEAGEEAAGGAVVGVPPLTVPCSLPAHPGFYLISPSEFERFSLSARNITEPLCSLDISWPRDSTRARCVEGPTQEACPRGQSHPCAELCTERGWPSVVAPLSDPGA